MRSKAAPINFDTYFWGGGKEHMVARKVYCYASILNIPQASRGQDSVVLQPENVYLGNTLVSMNCTEGLGKQLQTLKFWLLAPLAG